MTDNEIKEKLFKLWGRSIGLKWGGDIKNLSDNYNEKTINEIKALMLKDGVDPAEINKIMGV
jgi:hypothetical protein